jgi:predicted porin
VAGPARRWAVAPDAGDHRMKRMLLGTTAFMSAGVMLGAPALCAEPVRLSIGGSFNEAYMAVADDDGEGEAGNERNTDGFFNDAELRFAGSTTLDNGLEVGARVELEGETDDEQIDESWVYFSGGFGEARIGSFDDALGEMCVIPPGGTENFSAFSPNQWGANTLTSNSVCTGIDDEGDAQKIGYFTPIIGGFQLGLSYTPSGDKKNHVDGVGPHVGMPVNEDDESRHNVSLYATYSFESEDWSIELGAGGAWEGNVEKTAGEPNRAESEFYQAGIVVGLGDVSVGAAFEYYHDDDLFVATLENGDVVADRWVAGIGAAYDFDPWEVGIGYSIQRADIDIRAGDDDRLTLQRVALTADYELAGGIDLDGELAYTRQDVRGPDFADSADNYDAIEIGIGTTIEF